MSFFSDLEPVHYRYYDPQKIVLGKTMEEHLRFAVCFWHSFCYEGVDMFGKATFSRPWMRSDEDKIKAAFECIQKLKLKYFTFHDVDVAPHGNLHEVSDLIAKHQQDTHLKLLWGTANLFSNKRYMAGAATNPNPEVFVLAAKQVKEALDVTHKLGGENYVLWGGREGYETLLNTNLRHELDQYAKFLELVANYKHKIGFKGTLLIEPKPCEPTKHQYDFDAATTYAFLQHYGLEKEYKLNLEANHATLAGHTFSHEVDYALSYGILGSLDANQGDPLLGWDTDCFPVDLTEYTYVMYLLLQHGGFTTGGINFDAKLRRQSVDLQDLIDAHVAGVETISKALLEAEKLLEHKKLSSFVKKRYEGWQSPLGKEILHSEASLEALAEKAAKLKEPSLQSGKQERLEGILHKIF